MIINVPLNIPDELWANALDYGKYVWDDDICGEWKGEDDDL